MCVHNTRSLARSLCLPAVSDFVASSSCISSSPPVMLLVTTSLWQIDGLENKAHETLSMWMWASKQMCVCCCAANVYISRTKVASLHRCVRACGWDFVCVRVCMCVRPNGERENGDSIHQAHSSFSVGVRLQANQVLAKCALCKLL